MKLEIYTSARKDGSMKSLSGADFLEVKENKTKFLNKNNIKMNKSMLVKMSYDRDDYTRYHVLNMADLGKGMSIDECQTYDAVLTDIPNAALFLPLADCIGVIYYNEQKNILMMSHLGRHNLEQNGGAESVKYIVNNFNIQPCEIKVWLSPAAGEKEYPLFKFQNRSLHDVATEQILSVEVPLENIVVSDINSAKNENYFSHSKFLRGEQETDGRFAILAVIR